MSPRPLSPLDTPPPGGEAQAPTGAKHKAPKHAAPRPRVGVVDGPEVTAEHEAIADRAMAELERRRAGQCGQGAGAPGTGADTGTH